MKAPMLKAEMLIRALNLFDHYLWSYVLVFLLLGVGLLFTIRLKGLQFRYLGYALKLAFTRKDNEATGDISQFQALMTALAATIGIGSIAGVATAIVGGGLGAVFWMWIVALIGMSTKYAEAILAVKFRLLDHRGEICGGPMYYIHYGLKWKWLARAFALFGIFSSLVGGNIIQSHSIADAISDLTCLSPIWIGIVLAVTTGIVLLRGINNIGRVCTLLVPLMAGGYILGGVTILIIHGAKIFTSLSLIINDAFNMRATTTGFFGLSMITALQFGVARGISSNEAGLGSGPIAAAAAKTDVPGRQALISMTTVFLSTLVVCTITALVISVTGVFEKTNMHQVPLNGAPLVMEAFRSTIPYGNVIVAIGLILFGYSTIVGWAYYGEKCTEYLFGERMIYPFRLIFCLFVFLGTLLSIDVVWPLADSMNGLMTLPNLIALFALSGMVIEESRAFTTLLCHEKRQNKRIDHIIMRHEN